MVNAVGLAATSANLNIMREASLSMSVNHPAMAQFREHTRMAACRDLAMSLSCSSLGLLPRISGSQKVPTAPFMCPILP